MTYRIKTTDTAGNTSHHLINAETMPTARAIARIAHAGTHGVGFSTVRAEDWYLNPTRVQIERSQTVTK